MENEEHLIRLPTSALNTLNAQYGDFIYINDERYQLEQVVNDDGDYIRIPESARKSLNVQLDEVIRDSDLRSVFENSYIVRNIHDDEAARIESDGNESKLSIINRTTVNIGSEVLSQSHPSKIIKVYVNDTKIAQVSGIIENKTYPISINNVTVKTLPLNTSSSGVLLNNTYSSSDVAIILEDNEVNSSSLFTRNPYSNRFLNIDLNITL